MLKTEPLSCDADLGVALLELADLRQGRRQQRLVAVDADVVHHHVGQLRPDPGRALAARSVARSRASRPGPAPRRRGPASGMPDALARRAPSGGPARRPKTSRSTSEFVPSRLAPWTLTQAHSPAAYSPGTTVRCGVAGDPGMDVGRDAAHRVVGGRLDRHRLGDRLDALVDPGEVGDVGQLLLDHLARRGGGRRGRRSPCRRSPGPSRISR